MQVRPLKLEELSQFGKFESDAFVFEPSLIEDWLERLIRPNVENTRGLFEDDGEMKAVLRIIYPRLWLGNATVPMPGITNVATPPENRRQGSINQLLTGVLRELHNAGYAISTLYPFHFPFYKKFGYELVSSTKNISVKFPALQKFRSKSGRWKQATADQWPEFNAIYDEYCQGSFGNLTRDESWWRNRVFRQGKDKYYTAYLWYDAQGKARAYLLYSFRQPDPEKWYREMRIHDMAWLDVEARLETLAFMANHDSQADKIMWHTAPDDEFFALLDDPREAEETLDSGYMLRVLDATKALQERPWAETAKASFSIALRDDRLEWNNIALHVEVAGGKVQVETLSDASKAGLSCDIRQLSQMYAGYIGPRKLAKLGLLEVRNRAELEAAEQAFFPVGQAASRMADHF